MQVTDGIHLLAPTEYFLSLHYSKCGSKPQKFLATYFALKTVLQIFIKALLWGCSDVTSKIFMFIFTPCEGKLKHIEKSLIFLSFFHLKCQFSKIMWYMMYLKFIFYSLSQNSRPSTFLWTKPTQKSTTMER